MNRGHNQTVEQDIYFFAHSQFSGGDVNGELVCLPTPVSMFHSLLKLNRGSKFRGLEPEEPESSLSK